MSPRTVIVGRRLRRQMMPSSNAYETVAICASGTLWPDAVGTDRLSSSERRARSSPGPRSNISMSSSPSRNRLTRAPESELWRKFARSCDDTPITRARSWSMSSLMIFDGSFASRCTFVRCSFWRTTAVCVPLPNRLKLICEMKPLRPSLPQAPAVSLRRTPLGTGIGAPPSTTTEMLSFGGHFQPEK